MSKISKVSLSHFGFNATYLPRGRKTLDEMLAWNLNAHVMGMCHDHDFGAKMVLSKFADGYEFLMQNCMSCLPIHLIWA